MEYLPKDHRAYWYYADIFREMAASIIKCQDKNGYWHPSMLDTESYSDHRNI
jgi:rhamnogalacturonyl hydrolase YesR